MTSLSTAGTITADGPIVATDAQREAESRARALLRSPEVRAAVGRVRETYGAHPQASTPTGRVTLPAAAEAIVTAAVLYGLAEDATEPGLVWGATSAHEFAGLSLPNSGYGIENPDNVYRKAMVSGGCGYELRGRMPAVTPLELHVEIRDAIPGTTVMSVEGGQQVATLHSDDLVVAEDGTFVITIDASPAAGRANHMTIPADGTSFVLVRDLLDDWEHELPARLELVRTTGPAARPSGAGPSGEGRLAGRCAELADTMAPFWLAYFDQFYYAREGNVVRPARIRPGGRGLSTGARFDLADDEALVFTLDALGSRSLGVQISDPWGVAYEYVERTSSLNGSQAVANPDGSYTFVVSRLDPGVANWLDPQDQPSGLLAARWQSVPDTSAAPAAMRDSRVVPLSGLDAQVAGMPRVSPEQRREQQRVRAEAYRRRWA